MSQRHNTSYHIKSRLRWRVWNTTRAPNDMQKLQKSKTGTKWIWLPPTTSWQVTSVTDNAKTKPSAACPQRSREPCEWCLGRHCEKLRHLPASPTLPSAKIYHHHHHRYETNAKASATAALSTKINQPICLRNDRNCVRCGINHYSLTVSLKI